jgi:hypothetical protein
VDRRRSRGIYPHPFSVQEFVVANVARYGVFRAMQVDTTPSADCFLACHGFWATAAGHVDVPCTLIEYGRETHPLRISEIVDTVSGNPDALKPQGITGGSSSVKNRYLQAFDALQLKHVLGGWMKGSYRTNGAERDLVLVANDQTSTLATFFESARRSGNFAYSKVHLLCCRVGDDVVHGGDWAFLNDLKPAPRAEPDTSNVDRLISDALNLLK